MGALCFKKLAKLGSMSGIKTLPSTSPSGSVGGESECVRGIRVASRGVRRAEIAI